MEVWVKVEISPFGRRVLVELAKRGKAQWWLADQLGVSGQSCSQTLRTKRPRLETIARYAAALGVNPKMLDPEYHLRKRGML